MKSKAAPLDQVMKALGDPLRFSVIKQLLEADGEEKVCGTFEYSVAKATFSHHINILVDAQIVERRQEGTRTIVSLRRKELQRQFPGLIQLLETN